MNPQKALEINSIAVLMRLLRILPLLEEINQYKIIFQAIRVLARPFYSLLLCLYTLNYTFAVVG